MIDLRDLALAAGFRLSLDPTAEVESSRAERRWLIRIDARYGWIGTHSTDRLAVCCTARRLFARLEAIGSLRVRQRGDEEMTASFDPADLPAVAGIIRAYRRQRLSDTERARRAERARGLATRRKTVRQD